MADASAAPVRSCVGLPRSLFSCCALAFFNSNPQAAAPASAAAPAAGVADALSEMNYALVKVSSQPGL